MGAPTAGPAGRLCVSLGLGWELAALPPAGLRDTEWLGRTQVLRRGPLTWYLDGAHTASSVQACVRWFRQALLRGRVPRR